MILHRLLRRFGRDRRGNIALMTALLAVPIIGALGLAVDYGVLLKEKTQLDSFARTAALQALGVARAQINAQSGTATNGDDDSTTNAAIAAAQAAGEATFKSLAATLTDVSTPTPVLHVSRVGETLTATSSYKGSYQPAFANVVGVQKLTVSNTISESASLLDQQGTTSNTPGGYIIHEQFTAPLNLSWNAGNYNGWIVGGNGTIEYWPDFCNGACPPPDGKRAVELDGEYNSWMSKKVFLSAGTYELRYFYFGRLDYPQYDPAYTCGSTAAEVAWDNASVVNNKASTSPHVYRTGDTYQPGSESVVQSDRIGVYLDPDSLGSRPDPKGWDFTMNTAMFTPGANNLIDVCLQSGYRWIERSVPITINTPGNYWLSFQAEGANDGWGGLLDDIRLCVGACPGTPQENYPWDAGKTLLSETFAQPMYNYTPQYAWSAMLDYSGLTPGWTSAPTGWHTIGTDSVGYFPTPAYPPPGGGGAVSTKPFTSNRAFTRELFLTPGYYRLTYDYAPKITFSTNATTYCGSTAGAANLSTLFASNLAGNYTDIVSGGSGSTSVASDTFALSVFLDDHRTITHPLTYISYWGVTSFADPLNNWAGRSDNNGPRGTLEQTSYSGPYKIVGQNLLDTCGYAPGWVQRTVDIRIDEPGPYWLTFEGYGTNAPTWNQWGAMVGNIQLTALGGLSMSGAPSSVMTVPNAPSVGTTLSLTNLTIASQ